MRWQTVSIIILIASLLVVGPPTSHVVTPLGKAEFASSTPEDQRFMAVGEDYRKFRGLTKPFKNVWLQKGAIATKALLASSRIHLNDFMKSLRDSEKTKARLQSLKAAAKSAGIGGLQTYLVVIACALIEVIKAEQETAQIDMRLWSPQKTANDIATAIREVVDSNTMIAGLGGSSLIGLFSDPLLAKLFAEPKTTFASQAFQGLVSQFTHMLINFGAFEITSELVEEASDRLPEYFDMNDPVVAELLKDKNHVLTQIILALKPSITDQDQKKSEIAGQMFQQVFRNVATILQNENNYLVVWIYNALRHRILTGQFLTLIASLSVANTTGNLLIDAPRFSWSLVFNLIGATVATYTPESKKYSATQLFQRARLSFNDVYQSGRQLQYEWMTKIARKEATSMAPEYFTQWLNQRRLYRQRKIDIFFERAHYTYNQLLNQRVRYAQVLTLPDAQNNPSLKQKTEDLQKENESIFEEFVATIYAMISIYESEAHFISDYQIKLSLEDEDLKTEINNMESLFRQYCEVYNHFMELNFYSLDGKKPLPTAIVAGINNKCEISPAPSTAKFEDLGKESQRDLEASVSFLELYYSLGVDELRIILDRNSAIKNAIAEAQEAIGL